MMEDRRAWLISPMTVKHSDLSWEAGGSDLVPGSASQTSSVTTGTHQPLSFLTVKWGFISALLGYTECWAGGRSTKIMDLKITDYDD